MRNTMSKKMVFKIKQNPCCEVYPFCKCDRALSILTIIKIEEKPKRKQTKGNA